MKKLLLIYVLFFWIQFEVFAQKNIDIQVETNQIVKLNVNESWSVVQNWEDLNKLVPLVVESTEVEGLGLGSSWDIHLTNGAVIKEEMVYYNSNERTMSYIMTETPLPIEDYVAIIKVEPYGINRSLVSFYTSCTTAKENVESISSTFKSFQENYLSNIEKQ